MNILISQLTLISKLNKLPTMKKLFIFILIAITVNIYSQSYEIDAYNGQTVSTCSGNVFDSNQGSGPSYIDGDYSNSEDYSMTICSSTAGQQIQIEFYFYTELNFDWLDIYDGTSTSAPYLGRIWGDYSWISGTTTFTETIIAVSKNNGCLHLVWHSDGSVVEAGYNGFVSCVPSSSGAPTVQDCLGAIPICGDSYSTTASYSNEGSYPDEINGVSSCLRIGERNSVWYVFTAQQTTNITFTLNPNSTDDYDWAMYDLSNSTCEDIFYNPSIELSCNYAIDDGTGQNTGASSSGNGSHQGIEGTQWNDPVPVVTGGTYLINVSNFSSSQSGYLIDFSASSGAMVDNTAPALEQIISSPACGEDEITFLFTERVLCSSVDASDFNITGPGGPYTVTSINCNSGAAYSESFTITLNTPLTAGGTYSLNLSGQVDDPCGNNVTGNSLSFSVSGVSGTASVNQNVTCNGGADGTAVASASGGTSPYSYHWDNGQNIANASNLSAGTHYVTITDNVGVCNDVQSVNITQPSAISVSFNTTDVQCNGGSDGTATAVPTGGNGATWTYHWNAGSATSSATNTGLTASTTYTVSVYDSQNCLQTATVSVSQPSALAIDGVAQQQPLCNGDANGQLSVTNPHGGTPGYNYHWNAGGATSSQTNTGLSAGTYAVTVTDAHGCTVTQSNINLGQPSALTNTNTVTDATCNGTSTGSIATNASGGTGSLSYTWSANTGGQTTATASGLYADDYDVTIQDANNCQLINSTITVGEDPVINISTVSTTDATCGSSNGSATVSASGGSGSGYTYAWGVTPAQTGATISGVSAGGYYVTVTDGHGCTDVATININNAVAPSITEVSSAHTDVLCNGDNTGSAQVSGSGGTGTLTYTWSTTPNQTGVTATNLAAGPYTASVTDANGCISTVNITISEPAVLNVIVSASQDPTCNGGSNGQATASSSGGPTSTSYTYLWSAGGTINSATNTGLSAGVNYTVTVTDDNSCTATASVTLSEPTAVSIDATSFTNPLCFGDANGTATITTVSGGTSGTGTYNYSWNTSPVQNGQTATNLSAGTYNVTVSDDNACTATTSFTLSQPTLLQATTTLTDVQCNGGNDGTATVTGTGGDGNYTYNWNTTPVQAGQTATGLIAGPYNVTVTDGNGCEATSSATISEPTALSSSISYNNVNCFGESNGYAIVTATGGTSGYTYLWTGGSTSDSIGGLPIGTYYVTITDANGCTYEDNVLISQPTQLTLSATASDVHCHGGNDGQGNLTTTGGTTPYTYLWSNGETSQNITDIAGVYTVTVTDNHSCTETETITINEPDTISVSVNITNPNCGNLDGSASVTPSGGVGSYYYIWSANAGSGITNSASSLGAGSYNVSITDDNSCLFVQDIALSDNGAAIITVNNIVNNRCYHDSLGSAEAQIISGGSTPFTYTWLLSSDTLQTSGVNSVDSLPAGIYSVVVEDNAGCISTESFTINENNEIIVNLNYVEGVKCFGDSNAVASVDVIGGAGNYSYAWSHDNLLTDTFAVNLPAGIYTVTIIDDSLCTATDQITFNNPPLLMVNLDTIINVSCYGGNNGSITAQAAGGTAPYSYLWSNSDNSSISDSLIFGYHTVTITDYNLCAAIDSFEIVQPTAISASLSITNSICGGATGSITVTPSGGTPGTITDYNYYWVHDTLITTNTANNLAQNSYSVSITDSLGCSFDTVATVNDDGAGTASVSSVSDVLCNGESTGAATVAITGGTANFTYVISMGGIVIDSTESSNTSYDVSNLVVGTYNVEIYDANGCLSTTDITVNQPTELLISDSVVNIDCYNNNNGAIFIDANGGTPSYLYTWNTGSSISNLIDISAGYYSITVTDNNGCTKQIDSIEITQPTELLLSINSSTNASCYNDSTGAITINAEGGTPTYTYIWNNGETTSDLVNIPSGNYSLTLTDANNCTDTISATILNPEELLLQDSVKQEDYAGFISLYPVGGTEPYAYTWSNDVTTSANEYLSSGDYYVTVTDANGCTILNSYTIEIPLIVPSVITPNADGKNDYFNITNVETLDKVKISVFNRWGDLIFSFDDNGAKYKEQDSQWDGTDINGNLLPIGSYVYIIELNDNSESYKGTVTIVR